MKFIVKMLQAISKVIYVALIIIPAIIMALILGILSIFDKKISNDWTE